MTTPKNLTPGEAARDKFGVLIDEPGDSLSDTEWDIIAAAAIAAHEAKRESEHAAEQASRDAESQRLAAELCARLSPTTDAADVTRAGELLDDIVDELPVDSNDITDDQGGACVDLLLRYGQAARAEVQARIAEVQAQYGAAIREHKSLYEQRDALQHQLKAMAERAERAEREARNYHAMYDQEVLENTSHWRQQHTALKRKHEALIAAAEYARGFVARIYGEGHCTDKLDAALLEKK